MLAIQFNYRENKHTIFFKKASPLKEIYEKYSNYIINYIK